MKNKLLVFFGEYRTFDYVIKHFPNLNEYDIFMSTWETSENIAPNKYDLYNKEKITEEHIKSVVPDIKVIISKDKFKKSPYQLFGNVSNILHHWKVAVDANDLLKYDSIIFHRTDVISNLTDVIKDDVETDTLYLDLGQDISWVGDLFFYVSPTIVKQFVYVLDEFIKEKIKNNNQATVHELMGDCIKQYNFLYKPLKGHLNKSLQANIIRKYCADILEDVIKNNKNIFDVDNNEYFTLLEKCHEIR